MSLRHHTSIQASLTDPLAADRAKATALANAHRATLDEAERATDFFTVRQRIKQYRARVHSLERFADLGMLGENGIAPGIRDVLASARFHGARS